MASLIQASDGNLYGTTSGGGDAGYGTVFRLATNGGLVTLTSFANTNGASPYANLVQASDGNLYGTTSAGGSPWNYGTVFRLSTNGNMRTLLLFGGANGSNPQGGLVQGTDGYLYGTTANGGFSESGTVFRLTTNGSLTTLYFFGSTNGVYPYAGVIQASDGNLYGTTRNTSEGGFGYGTAFQLTTNGVLTTLANFDLFNTGGTICSGLVQADDGNLYGTTLLGGNTGIGTAFRLELTGELTPLFAFNSWSGGRPYAGLMQASDGKLYGTTQWGGSGTVFQLTTNGQFRTLFSFGYTNGATPNAGLIQAADGNLYGTTTEGGPGYVGTVYRVVTRPAILSQPVCMTNVVGGAATFSVESDGVPELNYQWQRDGTNLVDGADLWGATAADLTLTSLTRGDAANYRVVVQNGFGAVTSAVVKLTVELPAEFTAIQHLPDKTLALSLSTTSSFTWSIEASTNLVEWETLTNGLILRGTTQFIDVNTAGLPQRFYRAVLEP